MIGILEKNKAFSEVETRSLVASYGFEQTTGKIKDAWNYNNGTLIGTATRGETGLIAKGKAINISNGEIRVPHDPSLNVGTGDIAFSIWFQLNSTPSIFWLFNKRNSPTIEYQVLYNSSLSAIRFVLFNTDGTNVYFDCPYTPVANDKVHLAGYTQRAENKIVMLKNGVVASGSTTGTFKTSQSSSQEYVIGRAAWDDTLGGIDGKIDEHRLWIGKVPTQNYFLKEWNNGKGITL